MRSVVWNCKHKRDQLQKLQKKYREAVNMKNQGDEHVLRFQTAVYDPLFHVTIFVHTLIGLPEGILTPSVSSACCDCQRTSGNPWAQI